MRLTGGLAWGVAAATLATGIVTGSAPAAARTPVPVVVRTDGAQDAARDAVRRAGGQVTADLDIVDGFAARVPRAALPALRAASGVLGVTPDTRVHVAAATATDSNVQTVNSVFAREINADRLWAAGVTGRGVRVALVDTGVSAVGDLAGRVVPVRDPVKGDTTVPCVDFSGEGTCADSYGHGTFVAGLIAGSGAASGGAYRGVAPGAEIVSIKIAGRDGSADVSKVLAAIQWVVSFRAEYGIRVLNLSLGTDSPVSAQFDPLNLAVQRAWRSGLVVVVAASNRGPAAGTISKPGDDPLVITVGAVDDRETPAIDDDRLPHFSGRGPTVTDKLAKPDVVAPGGRVVSLRAPGSHIESRTPSTGPLAGTAYRRGSGTSMSAGVVSGAAALVLQARPDWTPDRVKFAFAATARKVAERDVMGVGAGLVDAAGAVNAPPGLANRNVTLLSDGSGTLEGSRGNVRTTGAPCSPPERLFDPECLAVKGNETAQGAAWDAEQYRNGNWDGSSWYSSQWTGSSWYGSSWYGSSWYGSSWYGSSWYGYEDGTFYGHGTDGSSWYGAWG